MEFEKKRKAAIDSLRGFIAEHKFNPVTKKKIVLAKDSSYHYQKSEDAYVLLLPLAVKEMYMYVQPYVDPKTNLTEYCLKVGKITDLTSLHGQIYAFNALAKDDIQLNKGVWYVSFLADFFDPEKNKMLYKALTNSRIVVKCKTKYDNDTRPAYQDKAGYLEVQHLRVQSEGSLLHYVQILCCRAFKGVRYPATVSAFLADEWRYVSSYLNFVVQYYKLNEVEMSGGIQKRRIEGIRLDVLQAIEIIKKDNKKPMSKCAVADKSEEGNSVEDASKPSNSRKRKMPKKGDETKVKTSNKKINVDGGDSDKENEPPNADNNSDDIEMGVKKEILGCIKKIGKCEDERQ